MPQNTQGQTNEMRSSNRYYTDILGLLSQHILESGLSLAEARVICGVSKTLRT